MIDKWKVKQVGVEEIQHTEVNANSMSRTMFARLKANIKKSGLSSMISCYLTPEGKYVIISGNHRYKACIELGYTKLNIMYTEQENLSNDEIIALQLSHNSVTGNDDKGILKRLFEEISSIEFKEFASISVDDMEIEDLFTGSIVPVQEHYRVSLILYSKDIEALQDLLQITKQEVNTADMVIVADGDNESYFIEQMSRIKKEFEIKSSSIAFSKLLEIKLEE
jgi:hypothetical protein